MRHLIVKILLPVDIKQPEPTALAMNEDKDIYLQMKWSHKLQEKFGTDRIGYYRVDYEGDNLKVLERAEDQAW